MFSRLKISDKANEKESPRNGQEGFTVIELVIVVAIIGVLTAIAIPAYGGIQSNARDKSLRSAQATSLSSAISTFYSQPLVFNPAPTSTARALTVTELRNLGVSNEYLNSTSDIRIQGFVSSSLLGISASHRRGDVVRARIYAH